MGSVFFKLHINRLLKAILPSFFHEIDSMYTTLMYGLSPFLFALDLINFLQAEGTLEEVLKGGDEVILRR